MIESYKDLRAWQKGVDLVVEVYRLTRQLPIEERFGLVTQIRRAAVSITSNIAEGSGRNDLGDYCRHLSMARGSDHEVESLLHVAQRLHYFSADELRTAFSIASDVSRMLLVLQRRLRAKRD